MLHLCQAGILQGVHKILCFKIYSVLWPLSVSPRCQCVYTVCQAKHQRCSSRTCRVQKITFQGKTQYLMNTLYILSHVGFLS